MAPLKLSLEKRREMLINGRDQLLAKAFEAQMNLDALSVQTPTEDDEGLEIQRQRLENTRDNAQKGAEKLDDQLKKLPKPKDKAKA